MKAFVAVSSLLGLAAADPFYAYGYGRALGGAGLHPTGASFSNRSPQGLGKREAEADAYSGGFIRQARPGLAVFGLHHNGVGAFAHPVGKRDADAEAFGYGYAPVLAKGYPSWPGVVAPGFESTCYGCGLGKRSADAEADADAAYYTQRSPQGAYGLGYYGYGHWGKRSADAFGYYGYAPFVGTAGLHPTGASYSNRSPQGLGKREAEADAFSGGFIHQARPGLPQFGIAHNGYGAFAHPVGKRDAEADPWYAPVLAKGYPSWPGVVAPGFESTCYGCGLGKRSAEADADAAYYTQRSPQGAYGLGYYGYGRWGKRSADALGYYGYAPFRALGGAGLHPTGASFSNRSPQGLGKREAEADPWGYAPFYAWRPAAVAYEQRSPQGLGKREAEEEAAPAKALAAHPYGATSFVGETVWGFPAAKAVEKREAEPAVGYSNRSPQGAYAYGWAPAYYW